MTEFIYIVYDRKADYYNLPMFFKNDQVAIRTISMALLSKMDSPLYQYAEDYQLVCIGKFDDEHGAVIPLDHHIVVDSLRSIIPDLKEGVSCEGVKPPESTPPETLAE